MLWLDNMYYLSIEEILLIHKKTIQDNGGLDGIRDIKQIESAAFRPRTTIDGKEVFPKAHNKAAVLMQSLVRNHGFVDGNKRTGLLSMILFLRLNQLNIKLTQEEAISLTKKVAQNLIDLEELTEFIKNKIFNI